MLNILLALACTAPIQVAPTFNPKPWQAETVALKTSDDVSLHAELWRVVPTSEEEGRLGVDAPTVICLPMYRSTLSSYEPLVAPLLARGMNVLTLDLRGHGESAPELAERVRSRDAEVFQAMHLDVEAAVEWLESQGFDPTRVGLVGASVGCSVAAARAARDAGPFRGVVLMTPGAKYLGIDTLADAARWSGTSLLVLTSKEEYDRGVKAVDEAFRPVVADLKVEVFSERSIHGTRMFGKVKGVEEQIADWLAKRLVEAPRLTVPHFSADDPLVQSPGFIRRTLRVARRVDGKRFELMTYAVGESWTVGAKLQGEFAGTVELNVGGRMLVFDLDTADLPKEGVPVKVDGAASDLKGHAGSFRGWTWISLDLPIDGWAKEKRGALTLRYVPSKGTAHSIPGGGEAFEVHFQDMPAD